MRELIAFFAVRALSLITDLEVRGLAMKLIQDPATVCKGAHLLENNYQPGDFSLLRRLMEQAADQEALHSLGFGLRSMAKAHPSEDAEPALLYLYEHGPCSICRGGVVRQLRELNHLPAWMHIEFQFDCESLR